jgi:hypothetical protein
MNVSFRLLGAAGAALSASRPSSDFNLIKDVDKLDFLLHTLHTSVRAPVGKPVLVGGMTLAHGPKGKSVYLLLQVSVGTP